MPLPCHCRCITIAIAMATAIPHSSTFPKPSSPPSPPSPPPPLLLSLLLLGAFFPRVLFYWSAHPCMVCRIVSRSSNSLHVHFLCLGDPFPPPPLLPVPPLPCCPLPRPTSPYPYPAFPFPLPSLRKKKIGKNFFPLIDSSVPSFWPISVL